jgi:hypothetical protein
MTQKKQSKALVLWIIWIAIASSVVMYQLVLGHGVPNGPNDASIPQSPIIYLAGAQLAAAAGIRWFLMPKAKTIPKMLVLMIWGVAISEAVEFYGLFLIPTAHPQTKLVMWILALISIFQFVPVYANDGDSDRIHA